MCPAIFAIAYGFTEYLQLGWPALQNHFVACAGVRRHVQKLATHAKMVYRGTRMQWFEDSGAWRRTKFETKLNINEKIKRILAGRVIGSRIQECS